MKKTKLWKKLAALAVGAAMLFSKTAAYAQEEQPVGQAETVETENLAVALSDGQVKAVDDENTQYIVYKDAEPMKLVDGNTEKNLYKVTVTDILHYSNGDITRMRGYYAYKDATIYAVDGSHFCFTADSSYLKSQSTEWTLESPEKIEGVVNGSDVEITFEYSTEASSGPGMAVGARFGFPNPLAFFELYARTEDGKPMDDVIFHTDYEGYGWASAICYNKEGEISWADEGYDGVQIAAYTQDGYAQMIGRYILNNEDIELCIPDFRYVSELKVLDDNGLPYNVANGDVNNVSSVYQVWGDFTDKITVMTSSGDVMGDIQFQAKATDGFIANPVQTLEYQVENLAEGWDIAVEFSETEAFIKNPVTGETEENYGGLVSITATRKSDARLTPASYEFNGTQNLVFKFDNALADDIKEVKEIAFAVQDKVQSAGLSSFWIDNYGISYTYDLEKGELTLKKSAVASLVYGLEYPSAGNTYIGGMTYIAADGTEKTVNGEWYVKILEKSENAALQHIVELPEEETSISSADMQELWERNKTEDIIVKIPMGNNENLVYSFEKGSMILIEGKERYDFDAEIIKEYSVITNPLFTEDEFAFQINYNHEGKLPGTAEISIPIDNKWLGKTLYYYEVKENGEYEYICKSVGRNGMYTVKQDHCSSYVALTKSPYELGIGAVPGDVNLDDRVDLNDALLALKAALGAAELTPEQEQAADVDGDGSVKLFDVQTILKAALRIIEL